MMFNEEDFTEYPDLGNIIKKLNKFFSKEKLSKISKYLDKLNEFMEDKELLVPITFIYSIIAEHNVEFIPENIIKRVPNFLNSKNQKLKMNCIIILGFYLLANPQLIPNYLYTLLKDIKNESNESIKDNIFYFLHEFLDINPKLFRKYQSILLKALSSEKKVKNVSALLEFLNATKSRLNFKNQYKFRNLAKELFTTYKEEGEQEILELVEKVTKKFFPALKNLELKDMKIEEFHKALDDQFIMKKMDYRHIKRNKKYNLKEFIKKFKRSCDSDKEIYFYVKHKENKTMFFYELERDKLLKVFEKSDKISYQKLLNTFSPIIEDEDELTSFMDMLIRLKHVEGYYSKFYFYPLDYIKKEVQEKISKKGIVNLKHYEKYLPPDFIDKVISEVEEESNQNFLMGKDGKTYYSIKSINSQINETAAKNNAVDLKAFRDRLTDVDFIKLIKNLPKEYLTNFHKGTIWLTNIGKINVIKEVENSKIIGFFDLKKVSEKLKIKKILLMDILALNVDFRSGLWDENGEVFYYSKFLKEKIDRISKIPDEQQKNKEINALATKYNIDKSHILTKIDENIQLIGEEIKNQDHIAISEYMEKTGMDRETFLEFINDLGLVYFKKGDQMIFDPSKIEQAKKELQNLLFQKFKSEDYIILGNFDITTDLVENLIKDLEKDDKIKGIFYEEGDELVFYTEKGIKNLMLNNQMLFSFRDLFYSKELTERDLLLMRELFEDLRNEKQLKGHFDEETLTFSSEEVIFASDYNAVVDKFSILVNGYAEKFNEEFEKVKRILTKRNKIIYPQEIKQIQDIIDKINLKYVKWRADIESTVMKANKKLLRDQGYTFKRYNGLATDKQEEIKLFKEDPDVYENIDNFEAWVSLFNELEISYGKIIFLQKKLINNPDDEQTEQELEELLERLSLI